MFKRSTWIGLLVVLGLMVGAIGGVLVGGVGVYMLTANRTPNAQPALAVQRLSAQVPVQAPSVTSASPAQDATVVDTVKKAEPAVVTILNTTQTRTQRNRTIPALAEGSGVIIDQQGHIVTNAHVVAGAQQIQVILNDGSHADAKLIGADSVSDIAVLQMSGNVPAYLSLGDSNALQLGETVIAIGSPLGSYRGSVTTGVVSGLNRSVDGTGQDDLIQTDAAINHGNSGGPLINLSGQVIGINTLVVQNTDSGDLAQGLGFAIPSNTVSAIVQQLIAKGSIQYPFMGISYAEVTPEYASAFNLSVQHGALIQDVTPGGPAANAGIQQDDIITALDNQPIDENHSLRSILFQHQVGDTVTATVLRNGQTLSLKLTLVARPAQSGNVTPG
ncbi:MAG TPA: trypsin-like peptidase domain-containing protein [Anaerolineae bacterium]|nr:trypsin-like peptidase domain-containing protein [Anaerolineae bacterium]